MPFKWIQNKRFLSIKKQDYIISKQTYCHSKGQLRQSFTHEKIREEPTKTNKISACIIRFCHNMSPLPVIISSNFDGGNGDVIKAERSGDGAVVAELTIRQEPFTEGTDKKHHKQW